MLIFEAWDIVAMCAEHSINEFDSISTCHTSCNLKEAFKICDGLMDMLMMKIDSMKDEITITREDISEALGYEK